jgi:hypothetical protein
MDSKPAAVPEDWLSPASRADGLAWVICHPPANPSRLAAVARDLLPSLDIFCRRDLAPLDFNLFNKPHTPPLHPHHVRTSLKTVQDFDPICRSGSLYPCREPLPRSYAPPISRLGRSDWIEWSCCCCRRAEPFEGACPATSFGRAGQEHHGESKECLLGGSWRGMGRGESDY